MENGVGWWRLGGANKQIYSVPEKCAQIRAQTICVCARFSFDRVFGSCFFVVVVVAWLVGWGGGKAAAEYVLEH